MVEQLEQTEFVEKLVFFDLETSGLDINSHAIIQIAAIAVTMPDFAIVETFERKIKFKASTADRTALEMNVFSEIWKEGEPLDKVVTLWNSTAVSPFVACADFTAFLKRHATVNKTSKKGMPYAVAQLCGHNSEGFDLPFLKAWYKRLGDKFLPADWFSLDTLQMAKHNLVLNQIAYPDLKLGTLCKFHNIPDCGAHDALCDVRMTAALCQMLHTKMEFTNDILDGENAELEQTVLQLLGG